MLSFAHFPRLLSFSLVRPPLTAAGAAVLAQCERLRELTSLHIVYTRQWNNEFRSWAGGVQDRGVRSIATSPYLTALRALSLISAGIEHTGAFSLADSPNLAGLKSLDLTGNPGIGPAGRAALIDRFGPTVLL
jgi:hypothetical protein